MRARAIAPDQRGAATILAVALSGVLLLVALAGSWVTAVLAAHRQAQSAADLAALAAASSLQRGGSACGRAEAIARDNQAAVVACAIHGSDVVVQVRVRSPGWRGMTPEITGRARAGPGPAAG